MGTTSKGNGVWINPWKKERHYESGAFGQSLHQKIRNYNERIIKIEAIRDTLGFDKGLPKEVADKLRKRLKELTR